MMKLSINGKETHVHVPLLGEFNVLNVLAVAAILLSLGKNHQQIEQALNKLDAVPGRMQRVSVQKGTVAVVVDYAHTPAALFAALNAVREHCVGKLICVFGCGGNRDAGKRSQMGEIASRYSDHAVITSDNPRNEKPQDIIDEIISGCVNKDSYTVIVDRKQAIEYALQMASANDAVLIAGKGHEKYQYIKDQKLAFDDVEIAAKQLARLAHG
jgi:UDP-N-acetylmuramoyl-L-alanyl-D-glutamate--2,6-diaminopimelate ligase